MGQPSDRVHRISFAPVMSDNADGRVRTSFFLTFPPPPHLMEIVRGGAGQGAVVEALDAAGFDVDDVVHMLQRAVDHQE